MNLRKPLRNSLICAVLLAVAGTAQARSPVTSNLESIQRGDYRTLSPEMQSAVASAQESARVAADLDKAPRETLEFSLRQSGRMLQQAREAYVKALPPRDQARGASVMLSDDTAPDARGKLYYFVSRSMPPALLRAYALESLHTGGTLVVKGVRKGETIKEYLMEAMADFNSADGQVLSGLEINPNLFDMFQVTVVPTVVWTNRRGLDETGSGCENLPEHTPMPQVTLEGPDGLPISVDLPVCAPAPDTSYFKIAGALTTPYVLDRFEEAGAPKAAMTYYRDLLSARHRDVHDGTQTTNIGHAMAPIAHEIRLEALPRNVLLNWQDALARKNVKRGPYGPVFSADVEDDADYRKELLSKIKHGLGI